MKRRVRAKSKGCRGSSIMVPCALTSPEAHYLGCSWYPIGLRFGRANDFPLCQPGKQVTPGAFFDAFPPTMEQCGQSHCCRCMTGVEQSRAGFFSSALSSVDVSSGIGAASKACRGYPRLATGCAGELMCRVVVKGGRYRAWKVPVRFWPSHNQVVTG